MGATWISWVVSSMLLFFRSYFYQELEDGESVLDAVLHRIRRTPTFAGVEFSDAEILEDGWFEKRLRSEHIVKSVQFRLIPQFPDDQTNCESLLPPFMRRNGNKLLFHAAERGSAESIAVGGILLNRGRTCLDFSRTGAFYLTPEIRKLAHCFFSVCG